MTEIVDQKGRSIKVHDASADVPANSPVGMMMRALQQGADIDTLEKMMSLQERWDDKQAEKAFNEALAEFKAEAVEIIKKREVDYSTQKGRTNYKHAELSDVVEAVGPALSKHGFAWSWKTSQDGGQISVTCILKHRQGHSESVTLTAAPDATGGKNSIQSIGSTVTYLQRYTLKAITGVSEAGDDDDGVASSADQELMGAWISAAQKAKTEEDLNDVWQRGVVKAREFDSLDFYNAFKDAVMQRKQEILGEKNDE